MYARIRNFSNHDLINHRRLCERLLFVGFTNATSINHTTAQSNNNSIKQNRAIRGCSEFCPRTATDKPHHARRRWRRNVQHDTPTDWPNRIPSALTLKGPPTRNRFHCTRAAAAERRSSQRKPIVHIGHGADRERMAT
jgi:hypothetical protein